jgi:hypothetical protein
MSTNAYRRFAVVFLLVDVVLIAANVDRWWP